MHAKAVQTHLATQLPSIWLWHAMACDLTAVSLVTTEAHMLPSRYLPATSTHHVLITPVGVTTLARHREAEHSAGSCSWELCLVSSSLPFKLRTCLLCSLDVRCLSQATRRRLRISGHIRILWHTTQECSCRELTPSTYVPGFPHVPGFPLPPF